jgi:hypothetical protein
MLSVSALKEAMLTLCVLYTAKSFITLLMACFRRRPFLSPGQQ